MKHQTEVHRRPLVNTLRKIKSGRLTLGFIGGSITAQNAWHNWPEPVIAWFNDTFPDLRLTVENAAIGATGSDLAVFRVERDLIERGCDLIFIDYAVNDNGNPKEQRARSREGLIRKVLAANKSDTVLVYTHCADFIPSYLKNEMPDSIAELEQLAVHYDIGSVWVGLAAYREVERGLMRFEEWLPDGLHPQSRGSLSYGQSVIRYLEKELCNASVNSQTAVPLALPKPLNPMNWEKAAMLGFDAVTWKGPMKIRRWTEVEWIHQAIETSAIGARLEFEFEGRGLSLGFDFGKLSSEFKWSIDGGEWITEVRDRPAWCGNTGWFRISNLCDDLPYGKHKFELEVIHGQRAECMGTRFCLGLIGIIR
ncbi:MAG: SGNH/GDSL hydrolase family protein [Fibrobacteres bacterium]|nr:SGNH/GDSL hydrolase family protein [Fibrobacterota bacterium]